MRRIFRSRDKGDKGEDGVQANQRSRSASNIIRDKIRPGRKQKEKRVVSSHSEKAPSRQPIKQKEVPDFPEIQTIVGSSNKKIKQEKLIKLIRHCETVYDFRRTWEHEESRARKLEALRLICSYIADGSHKIDVILYKSLMKMIMSNIFRELGRNQLSTDPRGWDWDEDKPKPELAWEHLERCYTLLHHILRRCTMDENMSDFKVTFNFVSSLLENFNSTDSRERYMVKLNIHQIYKSNTEMRKRILVYISNVFLRYVFEDESFLGVKEMLELLVPIINGMSYPLRRFNVSFLEAVLLPMHKCHYYTYFVSAHISCMRAYMIKDPAVAPKVLVAVLKYWPRCATKKEVFMLLALHDFIEVTKSDFFAVVRKQVWSHLARCCNSLNEGIANCSMQFWNDAYFLELVSLSHDEAIRLFFPQIASAAFQHWAKDTREMARSLLQAFEDINPQLTSSLLEKLEIEKVKRERTRARSTAKWSELDKMVRAGQTWKPGMKLSRKTSQSSLAGRQSKQSGRRDSKASKAGSRQGRSQRSGRKRPAKYKGGVEASKTAKVAPNASRMGDSTVNATAKIDTANASKQSNPSKATSGNLSGTQTPGNMSPMPDMDKTFLGDTSPQGNKSTMNPGNKSTMNPGNKSNMNPGNKSSLNPGNKSSLNPGNQSNLNPGNKSKVNSANKVTQKAQTPTAAQKSAKTNKNTGEQSPASNSTTKSNPKDTSGYGGKQQTAKAKT